MKKTNVLMASFALLLTACASTGPATVSAVAGPEVELTSYTTFGYLPHLGTDRADRPEGERSGFSIRLIAPTSHELIRHGLRQSTEPDLWVDFHFVPARGVDLRSTPDGGQVVNHPNWARPASVWPGYSDLAASYAQGSLLVSLIDRRKGALVAEGTVLGRSTNNSNNNDFTQGKVNTTIAQLMNELMPR